MGKLGRAFNNLDLAYIVPDGDDYQILYDPQRKVKYDSDGITFDTGKAAADDRRSTFVAMLQPVKYGLNYVKAPADGWDSLLASKAG